MSNEKKIWFKAYSFRFWVPVSLEGWITTGVAGLVLFLVLLTNDVSGDEPFRLSVHWPLLVEMVVAIAIFHAVSRGHVEKHY